MKLRRAVAICVLVPALAFGQTTVVAQPAVAQVQNIETDVKAALSSMPQIGGSQFQLPEQLDMKQVFGAVFGLLALIGGIVGLVFGLKGKGSSEKPDTDMKPGTEMPGDQPPAESGNVAGDNVPAPAAPETGDADADANTETKPAPPADPAPEVESNSLRETVDKSEMDAPPAAEYHKKSDRPARCSAIEDLPDYRGMSEKQRMEWMLRQTNRVREAHGVNPVQWSEELAGDSLRWTKYLIDNHPGKIGHPSTFGKDGTELDLKPGQGENVAYYTNPLEVVEGWCRSDGHFQNMIRPEFTHYGQALIKGTNDFYVSTSRFQM
ncbi:MAG: CAP domain-containing protein [Corynebacterium sp.]|uniref:CAP domain-containing protein n=1 Tax=Corynebacterium sp. TaxID=1720 RepID=UPI0026DD5953|nr:CAP domain-containing protein [Corynebacterium sp.]MDO5099833.1 CAP domain-containing protein [Corynebacterium sp.]